MNTINIHQAKTQLSQLLIRVQQGEKIIIANRGKPVAVLTAYHETETNQRIAGRLQGQFTIPDDFYEPDEEIINLFEGEKD